MVEEQGNSGAESEGAVGANADAGVPAVAGQESGDSAGTPDASSVIDRNALPEEMRNKSPEEISLMWSAAARVLESKNSESESQNARIAQLEAAAAEQKREPVPDPTENVDLKELMYENPEKAVDIMLEKKYGPTVARFEAGIGETEIVRASRIIGPDFIEHEPAVRAILAKSKGPIDEAAVQGAYFMARGLASVQTDVARAKLAAETPAPTPEITEGDAPSQLQGLAKEIQRGSGLSEEDFVKFGEGELVTEVPGL